MMKIFSKYLLLSLWEKIIFLIFFIGYFTFYCLPLIVFQGDCIISPHDNLDSVNSWFEMFRQNALFLAVNQETPCFSGLSTTNYAFISFSFQSLLYALFDNFTAYTLNYIIAYFLAFVCMLVLLEEMIPNNTLVNLFVALIYAALPITPSYAMAAATMPIFFFTIYRLYFADNRFDKRCLLLIFLPFFSMLTGISIFCLAFWGIVILIYFARKKILPINLTVGFVMICVGSVIVEWRLFYSVFFVQAPLNRSVFYSEGTSFISAFIQYFCTGQYHVPSLHEKIILPLILLLFVAFLIISEGKKLKKNWNEKVLPLSETKVFLFLLISVIATTAIGALYETHILDSYIKEYIPFLAGFNWGRFWVLNRVFWYILFALSLKFIIGIPKGRIVVTGLLCFQMFFCAIGADSTSLYNHAPTTWMNEMIYKPQQIQSGYISYNDFYSTELFEKIKQDINYTNEHVVAVGYHPAVLMFNGFHCIDGYLNAYELSYMEKFRTLIAPELDQNENKRKYYDWWGGRMYLFNEAAPYLPTWKRVVKPIELNIDPVVMRETFDLRYIISRAPIENIEELGLFLVKEYLTEGLYDMYVYKI